MGTRIKVAVLSCRGDFVAGVRRPPTIRVLGDLTAVIALQGSHVRSRHGHEARRQRDTSQRADGVAIGVFLNAEGRVVVQEAVNGGSRPPLAIEPAILDRLRAVLGSRPRRARSAIKRATFRTRSWPRSRRPGASAGRGERRSASHGHVAQKRRTWRGLIAALTRMSPARKRSRSAGGRNPRTRESSRSRPEIAGVRPRRQRRQLDLSEIDAVEEKRGGAYRPRRF
jgi:hypothetical protein